MSIKNILYKNSKFKYTEEVKDANYNGLGKEYYYNGELRYDGEWKDGKRNGLGKEYYYNGGLKYEGQFNDDNRNLIYKKEIKDDDLCLICMIEKKNMVFIPCGHLSTCEGCSIKYKDDKCIVCRREFSISYKIFF